MNPTPAAATAAVAFVWLGMVLAISFLEAPLKFRAPGVSLQLGLGIGRVVFRALNTVEAVFALVIVVVVASGGPTAAVVASAAATVALLAAQLGAVRPRLTRRSTRVLAGEDAPRSRAHLYYIALEAAKAAALVALGASALAAVA